MKTITNKKTSLRLEPVGETVAISDPNATYCAFTDVTHLGDGELLIVYYAGTSHLDGDSRIEMRRSRDEGRTWSEPSVLLEPIHSGYGLRDPHIAQLRDGRLILSWFVSHEPLHAQRIFVSISEDRGASWSEPIPAGPAHMVTSGKVLELETGELLLPFYGVDSEVQPVYGEPVEGEEEMCGVVISRDGGRTWSDTSVIHREPRFQGLETEVARLDDGRVVSLSRRSFEAMGLRAVSEDGGRTWSRAREVPVGHAPGILVDGPYMLVNHRAYPDGRARAKGGGKPAGDAPKMGTVISLSLDAGESFVAHLSLALPVPIRGGDSAYGGVVKLPDGAYYTTFYRHTEEAVHIYGQRFKIVGEAAG